jgi:hypothetical protein
MAVVVEPVLSEEKVRSVLQEGHEQSALDYKTRIDLNDRREVVELSKDIAAMQAEESGGYIVIGADDHGNAVADLTPTQAKLLDEATLRSKIKKYISEPFDVRSATHSIDGKTVVLIYIGPSQGGWSIFAANGEYEVESPPGSGNMQKKFTFRVGDVFVRHGTASERWNDTDIDRIIRHLVDRRKEVWRAEIRSDLVALVNTGRSAQQLEQMPSAAFSWKLDAEGFEQLTVELIRRGDDIPIRQMLIRSRADAETLALSDFGELSTLLDRLCSLAGVALTYERTEWLHRGIEAMVRIYDIGFDSRGYTCSDMESARLWLWIIARIHALGGLAVRLQNWPAVRLLANRLPHGHDLTRQYGSWLRHSLTMAARAGILEDEEGAGVIARAHNVVRRIDALHPDAPAESDIVLNSLCQFDALGALVVIGERHATHRSNFYPSFARYYSERTIPAFITIVTDRIAREALFDGDDQLLAHAITQLSEAAQREGFRYNGWDGLEDERVSAFVRDSLGT